MDNNNWDKWSDQIKNVVDSSINSKDFSNLSSAVGKIVNQAVDGIQNGVKEVTKEVTKNSSNAKQTAQQAWNQTSQTVQENVRRANEALHQKQQNTQNNKNYNYNYNYNQYGKQPQRQQSQPVQGHTIPRVYGETTGPFAMGIVMAIFGGCGVIGFGIGLLLMLITIFVISSVSTAGMIPVIMVAICLGACIWLLCAGTKRIGLINRFRRYIREIGNKMYFSIKELANRTGRSIPMVQKDLKLMIEKGLFLQGHMDDQGTCIMVNDDVYKHYLHAREQYKLQQQEKAQQENEKQKVQQAENQLPENVRQVISAGEGYIQRIHQCNDRIKGEEISGKISRMEDIVQKIFQRVRQKPELVGEIKKMMDYYLPTTVKLLDAYAELDEQPVQGQNIISSKQEIEKTLDTINTAFENLLDGFFRDTAWDISSDISVLETMFAQEGLTPSGFEKEEDATSNPVVNQPTNQDSNKGSTQEVSTQKGSNQEDSNQEDSNQEASATDTQKQ